MGARHILLTHFSQRYRVIAPITEEVIKQRAFVAFDHLQFKLSDLEWMHLLLPIFNLLFNN